MDGQFLSAVLGASLGAVAAFPGELVEIPLLLSTSPFSCPRCGTPWRRVVRKGCQRRSLADGSTLKHVVPVETLGWRPGCSCEGGDGSARCVVLDSFVGSGTTMLTALQYGRTAIGIDLSEPYCRVAAARLSRPQQQALDLVREAPLLPRVAVQMHPGPEVVPGQAVLPMGERSGKS